MVRLFEIHGLYLQWFKFNSINNGSFGCIFSTHKSFLHLPISDYIGEKELLAFKKNFVKYKTSLLALRKSLKGKVVCGYGAANKTARFLSLGKFSHKDLYEIYDKNGNLHGLHFSGSDIPIVPPDTIRNTNPDYVLLFATAYEKEIIHDMETYGYKGKTVRLYPTIQYL